MDLVQRMSGQVHTYACTHTHMCMQELKMKGFSFLPVSSDLIVTDS